MNTPRHTILLIDDNPLLTDVYKRALEQHAIEVYVTHDGSQGLVMAQEIKPDLVLLDLRIHQMSGLTMLKNIRNSDAIKDLPVIIFTMSKNDDDEAEARSLGVTDYFHKDQTSVDDLVESIFTILKK